MRGRVPGNVEKGVRFNFFRLFRSFVGVRVKGKKERADDEEVCVGRSRFALKRGGAF